MQNSTTNVNNKQNSSKANLVITINHTQKSINLPKFKIHNETMNLFISIHLSSTQFTVKTNDF